MRTISEWIAIVAGLAKIRESWRSHPSSRYYRTEPRRSKKTTNQTFGAFGKRKAFTSFPATESNHQRVMSGRSSRERTSLL